MKAVRIAVLDSGVHASHPHIGGLVPGVRIKDDGPVQDTIDRRGHGTAIAAVIHQLAPAAEIVPVKIFDRQLSTNLTTILRAVDWCLENDIQIVNLSLGTTNDAHRAPFEEMAQRVERMGAVVVSAYSMKETHLLPGRLPGVVGVVANDMCEPDGYTVSQRDGKTVFGALPFPRDIAGVPRERNLNGVSFAVARMSGMIGRSWSERSEPTGWEAWLAQHAAAASMSAVGTRQL